MDRLEVIQDDHGKELKAFSERVSAVEKKDGGSDGSSNIKASIKALKKEVVSLKSTNVSSLWESLDVSSWVVINQALKGVTGVNVLGEGNENVMYQTPKRLVKTSWELSHTSQSMRS